MLEEIKKTKLEKLESLRKAGLEPYPEEAERSSTNREALENFEESSTKELSLVGRLRSIRPMGGSTFAHIEDGSEKIQLFLNRKNMEGGRYELFVENADIGDFIEAHGRLFKTKTGEITLETKDWKMLSKNLLPIPTEYYGLKNTEELLRRRYLDLMANAETREIFIKKNIFWQTVRKFLSKKGFLEVQTPVFENIPGGAEAEPFTTHHNALDRDYYMRISLELGLKRLLVGGYEKVFEIGRVFRNEGIDREHLQEYDTVETYEAYQDLQGGLKFTEKLFKEVIKSIAGGLETEYEGKKIDWSKKWPKKDYFELFKDEVGIDLGRDPNIEYLRKKADELQIKYDPSFGKGRMMDNIFKKAIRPKLVEPCFLVGHPVEVSPLSKKNPKDQRKVLRLQVIAGGAELANGFSELNDPIDQRARFEEQMKLRSAGDKEAQMLDEDFVEALEYGMPPAFGLGISERLFAFIMNKSVRETVIFPPMRTTREITHTIDGIVV